MGAIPVTPDQTDADGTTSEELLTAAPIRRIVSGANFVASLALGLMVIAVCADVVTRLITSRSLPGVVDGGEVGMVVVTFLALAETERQRRHVRVELITRRFGPRANRISILLTQCISVAVVGFMAVAATTRAYSSFQVREFRFGLLRMPIWPARIALAAGLALLVLVMLEELYRSVRRLAPGK